MVSTVTSWEGSYITSIKGMDGGIHLTSVV